MRFIITYLILSICLLRLSAQSTDSLQLQQILKEVIETHPSIKEAVEALTIADTRIAMAKAEYLPNFDGNAMYSHIGPVPTINFPSMGSFQLYPEDNYSASLNYSQVLYNFGKNAQNIKVESESKNLSILNIRLIKQKLTSITVNSFYTLTFIQEEIKIKDLQIQTLNEHIAFLEKKAVTGSSTRYELLSSKVKLSGIESQRIDLLSVQHIQSAIINSLLGRNVSTVLLVKSNVLMNSSIEPVDTLMNAALLHRAEVNLAMEKEKLALLQYQLIKMQDRPVFSSFALAGAKNGYIPDLNALKFNYSIGVGLRVPLYDANRKKNSLMLAKSNMNNLSYQTELIKRSVNNEVLENETNCDASLKKLKQFELQVEQATEAYNLAKTNYSVGAITNLDLLDAETAVSESRLYLLKSKIDFELSLLRLKISLGEEI